MRASIVRYLMIDLAVHFFKKLTSEGCTFLFTFKTPEIISNRMSQKR